MVVLTSLWPSNSCTVRMLCNHLAPVAFEPHARSEFALPKQATETYTAHATAIPAAQSNEVYLTLCTPVPSTTFISASDKRYSLDYFYVLSNSTRRL